MPSEPTQAEYLCYARKIIAGRHRQLAVTFLRRHRWGLLVIVGLPIAFLMASWFRYQPVNQDFVWDRWTHQMCVVGSVTHGYGCNFDGPKALAEQQEAEREHAAEASRDRQAEAAWRKLRKFVADLPDKSGAGAIVKLRAAGFTESEISQWAITLRDKLLAAGALKKEVDDYFGGDPYLPRAQ